MTSLTLNVRLSTDGDLEMFNNFNDNIEVRYLDNNNKKVFDTDSIKEQLLLKIRNNMENNMYIDDLNNKLIILRNNLVYNGDNLNMLLTRSYENNIIPVIYFGVD